MTTRTIVYIAGPFRGETPWAVEQNVREAEALALDVARAGFIPLCPHAMYRHFDKSLPDAFWLEATRELLVLADAILLLPHWQESAGARAERDLAEEIGLPIWTQIPERDQMPLPLPLVAE